MNRTLVTITVLATLLGLGAASFGAVFTGSGYVIASVIAIAAGLGIAAASARWSWRTLPTIAMAVTVLFTLSAGATRLDSAIGGAIPTSSSLREFSIAIVRSWKELLTASPPIATEAGLLTVPYLTVFLSALAAGVLALRLHWAHASTVALIPALTPLVVGIAFGTHAGAYPLVLGGLSLVVSVGWLAAQSPNTLAHTSSSRVPRFALAYFVLVAAAAAGTAIAPLATGQNRDVLRDHVVPPVEINTYITPMATYREYLKDYRSATLFTIEGLHPGSRVRLAAMDRFDGVVFNVAASGARDSDSGVFGRISQTRASASEAARALPTGQAVSYTVNVGNYTGVWIPSPGTVDTLDFGGNRAHDLTAGLLYNPASGTAITTAGLEHEDVLHLTGAMPRQVPDANLDALAPLALPAPVAVPKEAGVLATKLTAGETTPIGKARALESYLHREGFYSNGLEGQVRSRAGHTSDRIAALLSGDQMVGDDEQYAAAMALMAQSLGMPARVVMGFEMPADRKSITGDDVHAWVEIAFKDQGWITFDPTPPKDRVPQQEAPKPKTSSDPLIAQPPQPPQDRVDLAATGTPDQGADSESSWAWLWRGLLNLLLLIVQAVGVLLLIGLPVMAIVGTKLVRRRRRRRLTDPNARVAAGWREIEDAAKDLGVRVQKSSTHADVVTMSGARLPGTDLTHLATAADVVAFGPSAADDARAQTFWAEVDATIARLKASMRPAAWWRGLLNVRSLVAGLIR